MAVVLDCEGSDEAYQGGGMDVIARIGRVWVLGRVARRAVSRGQRWQIGLAAFGLLLTGCGDRWASPDGLDLTVDADVTLAPVTAADRRERMASDELEEMRAIGHAAVAQPPSANLFRAQGIYTREHGRPRCREFVSRSNG